MSTELQQNFNACKRIGPTNLPVSRFILGCYMAFPPIPVAARSKAWVCGFLLSGMAGSNPARGMDVFLLWVSYVFRHRSLWWADPASGGVLQNMVGLSVIVKLRWWWDPIGVLRHGKKKENSMGFPTLGLTSVIPNHRTGQDRSIGLTGYRVYIQQISKWQSPYANDVQDGV